MPERGLGTPKADIERARSHFPHATFEKSDEYIATMLETSELQLPERGTGLERGTARGLSDEEVDKIASAVVERAREDVGIRDVIIGSAMGEGAIPLYARETRKEVCHACRIDPDKPLEAGNVMATTGNAIGTLAQDEVRNWCSEIVEVPDGRCARARSISEAARECKEKHRDDTEAFFKCYIPAFSQITKGSNPGEYVTITDPGKTTFKVGEVISREAFEKENERVRKLSEKPAIGR